MRRKKKTKNIYLHVFYRETSWDWGESYIYDDNLMRTFDPGDFRELDFLEIPANVEDSEYRLVIQNYRIPDYEDEYEDATERFEDIVDETLANNYQNIAVIDGSIDDYTMSQYAGMFDRMVNEDRLCCWFVR